MERNKAMTRIKVCVGTFCHLNGSYNVLMCFQQMIEQYDLHEKVTIEAAFCMGHCKEGVAVEVDDQLYNVLPSNARTFFREKILGACA